MPEAIPAPPPAPGRSLEPEVIPVVEPATTVSYEPPAAISRPTQSRLRNAGPRGSVLHHPPTAANPPRPGDTTPPTGPPDSPPLPGAFGPPPLGPKRRRWRVAVGVLAVLLAAATMVSAGIIIGDSLNDEPVATETVPTPIADRPVSSGDDTSSSILPADPVGPLTGEESDEPVADVADAVSPSVVLIRTSDGQGSGIVWDAEEGYILTNDHVTGDASAVVVQFGDGNRISGTVIGGDSARDIAVVQVDPTEADLVQAVFAPTETVQVGQLAVAIGSPFGLDQSVTAGIVSAVNRINNFGGSDPTNPVDVEMIQTDAPINPGNSGGALADRDGRVIGMNTQIRTAGNDDIGNIGIGFAVPSDTIVLIAQRIVDGESLDLAHLGVSGATPTDGTVGALVQSVVSDAPADNAGLQAGDLIVSLGGELISSMAELSAEVKLFRPGDLVQVELLRDGERLETTVTLGSN